MPSSLMVAVSVAVAPDMSSLAVLVLAIVTASGAGASLVLVFHFQVRLVPISPDILAAGQYSLPNKNPPLRQSKNMRVEL